MKIPASQVPGLAPVARDYFGAFERVQAFFHGDYRDPKNFLGRSDLVKARALPMGKLVPILKEQNQRFGCGAYTLEKIDWLLERQACAVVTGQQAGLFGGPLFSLYKALTAIKLAARLNRTCEGCYVPVFWIASEDHDFREVNHVCILNKENAPLGITYRGYPEDRRTPIAQIQIEAAISACLAELEEATNPSEFKDEVLGTLREAYQPGRGFSAAFGVWLTSLLKAFGLIFIDPSDPRVKALARDLFIREIAGASPSTAAALAATRSLESQGYPAQVKLQPGLLNLFYLDGERHALEIEGDGFRVRGTEHRFTRTELLEIADREPERLSPNVVLRPLCQDTVLPTVAYVAGPGEIAYFAQLRPVYEAFDLTMPIVFPRKSLTLLENHIEKILDQYRLRVSDFWGNPDHLITEIVRQHLPAELEQRVTNAIACVTKNLEALEQAVTEFEPTLQATVARTRGRLVGQIEGLTKKITQAYKKRDEVMTQQLIKAKNHLYPNRHLQEREFNLTPFLFKHGMGLVDRLYEALDIANFEHQIVKI